MTKTHIEGHLTQCHETESMMSWFGPLQTGVMLLFCSWRNNNKQYLTLSLSFHSSPGSITPSRQTKIFGQDVICQPDLRYEQRGSSNVLVVSVDEVCILLFSISTRSGHCRGVVMVVGKH